VGEDVEDHLGPVDDPQFREIRDGTDLGGGQLMVENKEIGPDLEGLDDDFREFPPADDVFRVHLRPVLQNGVENLHAGGDREFAEFGEGPFTVESGVRFHANQKRTVLRLDFPGAFLAGKFPLERLDEGQKIPVHGRGPERIEEGPETLLLVFRDQMGHVDEARKSVRFHVDRRDQVQAQKGQVGQIVRCQIFPVEMGMNEAQPPETDGGCPECREVGDEYFPGRADDDIGDLPPAGD